MKIAEEKMKKAADTIRCLCSDMIDKANSGHPGAPLGLADIAVSLWLNYLNFDPKDVRWPGRDRLVFSGGHASSLLYALFHIAGVEAATMDELKNFRQLGSKAAGHPERGLMPGVEVSTGPLGQGIAMGVGMALAAKKRKTENKTWVLCGDGDLEEGISHEACSWAGAMKLDDLILVYDSNHITIEGDTALAMNDDAKKRFESYGWKVFEVDGHNFEELDKVFKKAVKTAGQPVLVIATTHIGFGAPTKQDSESSHGAPLGAEETRGLKQKLGFDPDKSFYVPEDVYALFAERTVKMGRVSKRWRRANPSCKAELCEPDYLKLMEALPKYESGKSVATRSACSDVLNAVAPIVPELIGGSADLGPSNKTVLKGMGDVGPGAFDGRNIHYGIRELAMTAIVNGVTAFGGLRCYGATFFVFSDYCKPALRMAALMRLPSLFIFSHDSFYVGEDGATHEPVEQLAALRVTPGLTTYRPADANETSYALAEMLLHLQGPSCLITSRQNLPVLEGVQHEGVAKGAYVIYESGEQSMNTMMFISSGSEVALCIEAAKKLVAEGRSVRVISMPSMELFLRQKDEYRGKVMPEIMKNRVIVEAGVRSGWDRFRMDFRTTRFVTMDHYGASAPCGKLAEEYGFTAENVYNVAKTIV